MAELLKLSKYALHYYRQAVALRPYDARMWFAMASAIEKLGNIGDALRCYRRAPAGGCGSRQPRRPFIALLLRGAGERRPWAAPL